MKTGTLVITLAIAVSAMGCASSRSVTWLAEAQQKSSEDPMAQLAWLAGAWAGDTADGRSEERWMPPRGGAMLGVNRMLVRAASGAEHMAFFEFLRIERTAEGIVYFASPRGRSPATPFALIESGPGRAVFQNTSHDFPQRIIYERAGNELHARIEGTRNGRPASQQWVWKRAKPD